MTDRAEPMPPPGPLARAARQSGGRRARCRGERGAAVVEFSLVVGLFVMMLVGIIVFGLALSLKHNVTSAAASGARAAVGAPSEAVAVTQAVGQANAAMSGFSGNFDPPVAAVANCAGTSGRCITVTVTAHPAVRNVPFMGVIVKDPLKSTAIVQIS